MSDDSSVVHKMSLADDAIPSRPEQDYLDPVARPADRTWFSDWTPPAARAALNQLLCGDFSRAGLLWTDIIGNDRALSALDQRTSGVTGLEVDIVPADESARAIEIAEKLSGMWSRMFPSHTLIKMLGTARGLGACLVNITWEMVQGMWMPSLRVWDSALLRYDREQWYALSQDGEIPITYDNGQWLMFMPYGDASPWERALVRPLALLHMTKIYALNDWNSSSEFHGQPSRVGTLPEGMSTATEQNRNMARQFYYDLTRMAENGAMVMPHGYDVKLLEASGKSTDGFEKLLDYANTQISITILGQNQTTEASGGGGLGAGNAVHQQVRDDLIEADAKALADTLRQQVLRYWTAFNWGSPELTPHIQYQTDPPSDEKLEAETNSLNAQTLLNLAAVGESVPIDLGEMARRMGLPMLEGDAPQQLAAKYPQPTALLVQSDELDEGQQYLDRLTASSLQLGSEVMQAHVQQIREIMSAATDIESFRGHLLDYYRGIEDDDFQSVVQRMVVMGNLAGRVSAVQEAQDA